MQRFYLPTYFGDNDYVSLDKNFIHQVTRVLRMKEGDECIFFGENVMDEYVIRVVRIEKKKISFTKVTTQKVEGREADRQMHLYQASLNKWEKMEWIVQKCVELGVANITFFQSERSKGLEPTDNKLQRLQLIAIEALEQCGGMVLPRMQYVSELPGNLEGEVRYMSMGEKSSGFRLQASGVSLLVGPEGGWSDHEVQTFEQNGYKSFQLGHRVFRAETAAIVGTSYLILG